MIRPLACLLALAIAFPAAAQIYSWRDKNGKMHYSDVPPATGEVSTVRGPARTGTPPAAGTEAETAGTAAPDQAAPADKPKTMAERELEFRQRRAQAAEAEEKERQAKAAAQQKAADCQRAQNQLAALQSGQRMARYDARGEREVLDDAARSQEIEQVTRFIAASCN